MAFETLLLSVIGSIIACVLCDTVKYIWNKIC